MRHLPAIDSSNSPNMPDSANSSAVDGYRSSRFMRTLVWMCVGSRSSRNLFLTRQVRRHGAISASLSTWKNTATIYGSSASMVQRRKSIT